MEALSVPPFEDVRELIDVVALEIDRVSRERMAVVDVQLGELLGRLVGDCDDRHVIEGQQFADCIRVREVVTFVQDDHRLALDHRLGFLVDSLGRSCLLDVVRPVECGLEIEIGTAGPNGICWDPFEREWVAIEQCTACRAEDLLEELSQLYSTDVAFEA